MIINGRRVSVDSTPYIVAEMNSSHNGNVETALKMVDKAKEAGCDAVKFQSWSADSLYSKNYYEENPIAKRMVSRFSLCESDLKRIADHCDEIGLTFSSTPYCKEEVDFLVDECKASFVKIASMDLNNILFLEYIAGKQVPIILSTGMGTFQEIERAVQVIEKKGNNAICILHCVSQYPTELQDCGLSNIRLLRERFPEYPIGFSDHTIGCDAALMATALGAAVIEKHFTLDNSRIGWDNQMATEPEEMRALTQRCRAAAKALGSRERILGEKDIEQRKKMRRSLVAAHDMERGTRLCLGDIDFKRPEIGLPADCVYEAIGKHLKRDLLKDEIIFKDDLE